MRAPEKIVSIRAFNLAAAGYGILEPTTAHFWGYDSDNGYQRQDDHDARNAE